MGWLEDLGKNLPVGKAYDDLLHPAAKEIGDVAKSTIKAARFILAPIDYLAAQQDRYKRFLQRVSENVKEEDLILAHPHISGPILDGIKYLDEESILCELFVNLLSRAIDKNRVNEAHPAFVNIISQLSPDEAVLIYHLSRSDFLLIQVSDYNLETNLFGPRITKKNECPIDVLAFPDNFFMYMDHLHSLNIAGIWQSGNQEPIMSENKLIGTRIKSYSQLTNFGRLFAKACVEGVTSKASGTSAAQPPIL